MQSLRDGARVIGGDAAKEELLLYAGSLVLVATKYPPPRPGPTVLVWRQPASPSDCAAYDNTTFANVHQATYGTYTQWLSEFRFEKAAEPAMFARLPSSRSVVRFTEQTRELDAFPVRLESNLLRWHNSWRTFNFMDLESGWGAPARTDFATVTFSLEFFPPASPPE